jgi:hypothetical protein
VPEETGGSSRKRTWIRVALLATGAAVLAVTQVVMEQATNPWYVLVGALTFIIIDRAMMFPKQAAALLSFFGDISWRRAKIAAGVATTLIIVAGTVVVVRVVDDDSCPHTTELRILTSPEGLESMREVTEAYARATADDGCPTVFPYVYAAASPAISGALAHGWDDTKTEHPLVDLGPRPDVWLPDSTVDVRQVRDILDRTVPQNETGEGRLPKPLRGVTSIASSPIVLAGSAAARDDTATLPELVGAVLRQQRPVLYAADPESSAAGLLAADGYLLDAGSGVVDQAVARRREQIIAGSAASGTDEVSLACAYLRRGNSPAAILTSLRTWRRMVAGKTGCPGSATPPPGDATPPSVVEGPALDFPFVRFTWSSTRHAQAADDLLTWLLSGNARPQLSQAGLDPPLPGCAALERNACVPANLNAMLEVHRRAKLPGRVLLAVDASGSMAARTGPGTATRFTVASQGVVEALGHLGPRDEFGLWTFPRPRVVGLAAGSLPHRKAIAGALRTVRPAGATPLYATIVAGLNEVAGGGDDKRIRALVVLTDGEDTGDREIREVAAEVGKLTRASGARLYVIATGDARCVDTGRTDEGLHLLTDAAQGECLTTSPGEADATMAQLFATLWGGQ